VLSGRGLCDELITHPEESYRLWCVVMYDLENLKNEEAMTRVGSQRHSKKKIDLLHSLLDVRSQAEMVTVTDVLEEFGLCKKEFIRNLHNADRHQNLEPENA